MEEDQVVTPPMETSNPEQDPIQESPPDPALVSLFECPVCYDYMEPPTFQCPAGHTICSRCSLYVRQCPLCRGELRNYRNLTLERLAEMVALPCVYRGNGCPKTGLVPERKAHEQDCPYRTCLCPSMDEVCTWEGVYQQVIPHLTERHPHIGHINHDAVKLVLIGLEATQPLVWITHLHCHQRDFIVQVFKTETSDENSPVYIIVQNVGSRQESGRFLGRIEIRGRGKTMLWESTPQSVTDDLKATLRMKDCLTLNVKMLERMLEDHILTVMATIYPVGTYRGGERPETNKAA
ncbi:E3 ubiquitin-protein ligase SIAH1A-like [Centruroides vittatus]|uniref:E3 ubiquitin-protein ligase SIAH1A-like n=1 Tax=Centruroides vittatus TaxID=120091 RepID=UPI0035102080